ncbi:hypothetical protein [Streptomyces sp. NPDC021224]|uniref:hypothetical protein n=1 Tax=unclassified Streptomyces TaxID=2593676 RepID=UPI0037AF0E76
MPGLLPPRSDAAEESAPEAADTDAPEGATAPAAEDASAGAASAVPEERSEAEAAEEPAAAEDADDAETDEEPDRGEPLFEVSDRRATILADKVGIVFRLDEEEADFTWDEIGAVEIDTPRFGKRFKVTVYTGPRRWFEAHVEAKSRGLLKTWTAELDAVLDEHFEDPDAKAEAEAEVETAEEPEATETGTETADTDTTAETETETAEADTDPEAEAEATADAEPETADETPASGLTADKPLKPAKPATSAKPRGKRTA